MLSFPSFYIFNSISCCCCGHFGSFVAVSCWNFSNLTPSSSMSGVYVCTHSHTHTPQDKKFTEGEKPLPERQLVIRWCTRSWMPYIWWISLWRHDKYGAVITLDVKNKFNTAIWGRILQALRSKATPEYFLKIIGDSLSDRVLMYETDKGPKVSGSGGVPRGSGLGNMMNDEVP